MKNSMYQKEGLRYVIQYDGIIGKVAYAVTAGKHAEDEDTAKLLSAAPDLLEALIRIVNLLDNNDGTHCFETAKAAIAKAKGYP